jgi:transposase-like protein
MKRNQFNKEFKAKVAVAAIKGQSTANELAQEYEVHVSQINLWKKQLLEAAPMVFGHSGERKEAAAEEERDRLYEKIGKLQVEVDWLKKKTGHLG